MTTVEYQILLRDRFSVPMAKVNTQLEGFNNKVATADTKTIGFGRTFRQVAGTMGLLGVAAGIVKVSTSIVQLGADMEQTKVSFQTMLGSAEKANKLVDDINEFANVTPFQNDQLFENAKLLLNFGMEGKKVIPTMKMIGDISGGQAHKFQMLSLAYSQARSAGKLMGQDLLQMINAGFNPLQELAKTSGKSIGYWKEQMSKGKVTIKELDAAFQSATAKGGRFYNMMEKQSKTLAGRWSTLMGQIKMVGIGIGTKLLPYLGKMVEGLMLALKWFKANTHQIKMFLKIIGAVAAVYVAYNTGVKISIGLMKLKKLWVDRVAKAQKVLNMVMKTNPLGLVLAGVVALIAAMKVFSNSQSKAIKLQKVMSEVTAEANKSIVSEKTELKMLLAVARDENRTKEERKKAIEKINQIAPQYLGDITLENVNTKETTKSINAYISALSKKAKMQAVQNRLVAVENRFIEAQQKFKKPRSFWKKMWTSDFIHSASYMGELKDIYDEKKYLIDYMKQNSGDIMDVLGDEADAVIDPQVTPPGQEIKSSHKVTGAAPKIFNLNVSQLVGEMPIYTQSTSEAPKEVQENLVQAMLEMLADVQTNV